MDPRGPIYSVLCNRDLLIEITNYHAAHFYQFVKFRRAGHLKAHVERLIRIIDFRAENRYIRATNDFNLLEIIKEAYFARFRGPSCNINYKRLKLSSGVKIAYNSLVDYKVQIPTLVDIGCIVIVNKEILDEIIKEDNVGLLSKINTEDVEFDDIIDRMVYYECVEILNHLIKINRMHIREPKLAFYYGSKKMFEWYMKIFTKHSISKYINDAAYNNLDFVIWVYQKFGNQFTEPAIENAASRGRLDVIKWLVKVGNLDVTKTKGHIKAIESNQLEVVKWYYKNYPALLEQTGGTAVFSLHMEIIQFFYDKGILQRYHYSLDTIFDKNEVILFIIEKGLYRMNSLNDNIFKIKNKELFKKIVEISGITFEYKYVEKLYNDGMGDVVTMLHKNGKLTGPKCYYYSSSKTNQRFHLYMKWYCDNIDPLFGNYFIGDIIHTLINNDNNPFDDDFIDRHKMILFYKRIGWLKDLNGPDVSISNKRPKGHLARLLTRLMKSDEFATMIFNEALSLQDNLQIIEIVIRERPEIVEDIMRESSEKINNKLFEMLVGPG